MWGSGEMGRVAMRGHTPIGYYKDPAKSAATFQVIDGVRYSIPGDFATVDADGTVRLLGRGSQCINTGGEKVYPEEVEEVLKLHPTVADAAVVGVPDERFGEAITALVEPHAGDAVDEAALIAHVKAHLAGYKAPKRIIDDPLGRPRRQRQARLPAPSRRMPSSIWTAADRGSGRRGPGRVGKLAADVRAPGRRATRTPARGGLSPTMIVLIVRRRRRPSSSSSQNSESRRDQLPVPRLHGRRCGSIFALAVGSASSSTGFSRWWGGARPPRRRPPTDVGPLMLHAPSTDGVRSRSTTSPGRAPHPIVLLAHATGFHGHAYLPIAKHLAPRFHTCGMDFRGHGDTALPAGWTVAWAGYGDDALAAAAAVAELPGGDGGIVGFGHSMGGAGAADGRRRATPALFRLLVLFEPIVFPTDGVRDPDAPEPAARRRPPPPGRVRRRSRRRSPTTPRSRRWRPSIPTPSTPTSATASARTATTSG